MILDQIRRIRAGHQQEIAALQAQLDEKQAQIDQLTNPDVQAKLDAIEAELCLLAADEIRRTHVVR